MNDKEGRGRITPSLVISVLALVVALGGGAYAAKVAKNSVGPKQLKKNAVSTNKIGNGAVTNSKLGKNSVTDPKIATGAVVASKLNTNARPRWALVAGNDGHLIDGSSDVTSSRDSEGLYFVDFAVDVRKRAISVTPTSAVDFSGPNANPPSVWGAACGRTEFTCSGANDTNNNVAFVRSAQSNTASGSALNFADQTFYIVATP